MISNALAAEIELGDGPGRGHAEHQVERHGDRGGQQRQPDRGQRVGLDDRGEVGPHALAQRLGEHGASGSTRNKPEEGQRDADQQPAQARRVGGGAARAGPGAEMASRRFGIGAPSMAAVTRRPSTAAG